MNSYSSVFNLIKSMTMSEKRYFKIFSKKHILGGQNKYIHLFNELESQSTEDDKTISESLSQKGFTSKYLSADKNYLYNLILRCLNEFYFEHNLSLTIKNNLQTIEILFHKGLYKECLKVVAQTEKLIKQGESFTLMLELLVWKRKCTGYAYGLRKAQAVNHEMDSYIAIVNNLKVIVDLYYTTYMERLEERVYQNQAIESVFENVLGQPIMQSEANALCTQSKIFYNLCYVHYYYFKNDFEKEYQYHKRIVEIIAESPHYQKENAMDCVALYNRLLAQSKYLDSEIFYEDLKYLDRFDISGSFASVVIKQRILIHRSANELEHLFIKGKYNLANDKIPFISKGINDFEYPIEPYYKIQLTYLFAMVAVSVGDYRKALDYTNTILNEYHTSDNQNTFLLTQILNIFIHFDLENYITVEYLTKAFLKKHKLQVSKESFEYELLNTLVACCKGGVKPRHTTIVGKFEQFLSDVKDKPTFSIQQKFKQENYIRWVKAKIEKKKIIEL